MGVTGSNCLAVVLRELGWSYTRLIAELRRHASVVLPKTESMVTLVSRWVNNRQQPDDFYRDLLSRATGRARAELFSDEPLGLTALPSGLVVARSGDGLSVTGAGPLPSGGDGLIAWLGQQEPELKDGGVERRSFPGESRPSRRRPHRPRARQFPPAGERWRSDADRRRCAAPGPRPDDSRLRADAPSRAWPPSHAAGDRAYRADRGRTT